MTPSNPAYLYWYLEEAASGTFFGILWSILKYDLSARLRPRVKTACKVQSPEWTAKSRVAEEYRRAAGAVKITKLCGKAHEARIRRRARSLYLKCFQLKEGGLWALAERRCTSIPALSCMYLC